ncbi:cytochrome P450 [Mycena galopus ATCC 62051]|nr:cytochrome P450 [Mycena galopus ATCC 62051]
MDPATLAIGAFFVLVLSLVIYQVGKRIPLPLIPHNKLQWFVGDIPFLTRLATEKGAITYAFDDTAMRLGPVSHWCVVVGLGASWASRLFGFEQAIVILADSQEMHDVLVNRAAEFDRSKSISALFAGTLPQGMLALLTDEHFGITMTNPYLARMTPRMVDLMQELVDLWSAGAKRLGGSTDAIDVLNDIRLATIDVIASITFGASFNGVKTSLDYLDSHPDASHSAPPEIPKLAADLEVLLDTIGDGVLFPAPSWLPWLTRNFNRQWRKAITSTHDYLRGRLYTTRADYALEGRDAEKASANQADNVLDMIMEREKEDRAKGAEALAKAEIIDELTTLALGGSETTATTMQWSVKMLWKHPDVQRKLRAELLNNLPAIASRPPTFAEITDETNLPYLSAVMYEILRCSRTASAVARDAARDTVLLGYPIPKGTQVLMPIGMFNPERWLRPDGSFNPTAGPWLPFSFGFRGCFGQKLALIELRLFISMIQVNFFFDAVPEELNTWKSNETVTNPSHPAQCYVRPIPWESMEKTW